LANQNKRNFSIYKWLFYNLKKATERLEELFKNFVAYLNKFHKMARESPMTLPLMGHI